MDEEKMARMMLYIANNPVGLDDPLSRLLTVVFEACKKGDMSILTKANLNSDKKIQVSWSIENLYRVFRELYQTLNWQKVFEAVSMYQ